MSCPDTMFVICTQPEKHHICQAEAHLVTQLIVRAAMGQDNKMMAEYIKVEFPPTQGRLRAL